VPRLVEALAGKKVVCAATGNARTPVWTAAGELFIFGAGGSGQLGHGGEENELVPRLVEALAEKTVIGAAAGAYHTAVGTEAGERFTFGDEGNGRLGHGGTLDAYVPGLVASETLGSCSMSLQELQPVHTLHTGAPTAG